jgi:3'(2'), 5'-bisphosphate nucleotidase
MAPLADAPPSDHDLAAELAAETGAILAELRDGLLADGAAPAEIKAEGDRTAHEHLMDLLARLRPDDAVLSEESPGSHDVDAQRTRAGGRVWIVDPLDGTREFGEGRSDWAVHVALAVDGDPAAGAVALPAAALTLSTVRPPHQAPLAPEQVQHPRIAVSRTRPPAEADAVARATGGTLVPMGSAGAKITAVLRGEVEIYVHAGGQYVWDNCAPVAVALAAGAWCSRLDGSPLRYDDPDPSLPDLVVCRPELWEAVRAAL